MEKTTLGFKLDKVKLTVSQGIGRKDYKYGSQNAVTKLQSNYECATTKYSCYFYCELE